MLDGPFQSTEHRPGHRGDGGTFAWSPEVMVVRGLDKMLVRGVREGVERGG